MLILSIVTVSVIQSRLKLNGILADQRAKERAAAQQRRREMLEMAQKFENGVGDVVTTISSVLTELQSAARLTFVAPSRTVGFQQSWTRDGAGMLRRWCQFKALFLIALCAPFVAVAADRIVLERPEVMGDVRRDYFVSLLEKALEVTRLTHGNYVIKSADTVKPRHLVMEDLMVGRGEVNLIFSGTSIDREIRLHPIRIPLARGLLGHRIFIVRKDRLAEFAAVADSGDLYRFSPCLGTNWADTAIMRDAGFDVIVSPSYENLFKMLAARRCDFFPRALHEPYQELERFGARYPELAVEPRWLLRYPFASYFFVHRRNRALAERVEAGLRAMLADDSFEHHFRTHPSTATAMRQAKMADRRVIDLSNSQLPADTPIDDPLLWPRLW